MDVASIPPARRRFYLAFLALAVPLLFFASVEGGLRLFGVGYPTSFFLRHEGGSAPLLVENQQFGWRFFPRQLARAPRPMTIEPVKPRGTIRVFVFGESAAYGDPVPAYGFPRLLEVLLRERYPERRFQIVNVAMTAINSHVILPIARDCGKQEGDVWVIYMGNNEVVGPFGPGTVFSTQSPPLPVIRTTVGLKRSRIVQAIDLGIQRIRGASGPYQTFSGMDMFLEHRLASRDPRLERVYSDFRENLDEILEEGLAARAQVILCTIGTNVRDCAPFSSTNRASLTPSERTQWDSLFQAGVAAQAQADFTRAAEFLAAALKIDDQHAELLFRAAQVEMQRGRDADAAKLFGRARDEDTLRFRADSRINQAIRELASNHARLGVRLVDLEKELSALSKANSPGADFFYEHVHLNFSGNYAVARLLAEQVASYLPGAALTNRPWLSERECAARLALTDWDRLKTADLLRGRTTRPPFTFQCDHDARVVAAVAERQEIERRLAGAGLAPQMAAYRAALSSAADDWVLHERCADLAASAGDFAAAASHGRQVVRQIPHHAEKWAQLGLYLEKASQFAEGLAAFQKALDLDPGNAEAIYGIGLEKLRQKEFGEAIRIFNRALRAQPRFVEAQFALGSALAEQGQTNAAAESFESILKVDPSHAGARAAFNKIHFGTETLEDKAALLRSLIAQSPQDPSLRVLHGKTLLALGRFQQSGEEFAAAIALDPDLGEAHRLYGELLAREKLDARALEHFARAVALMPADASAHFNFGVALMRAGRFQESVDQFNAVLQLEPGNKLAQDYAAMSRARVPR